MVGAAFNVNPTPIRIKENLYQTVPDVGVARVFDFLRATNEVLQNNGESLPLNGRSTATPGTRFAKGVALQKSIFGEAIAFTSLILSSGVAAANRARDAEDTYSHTNRARENTQ
jgi:hypothetical protein